MEVVVADEGVPAGSWRGWGLEGKNFEREGKAGRLKLRERTRLKIGFVMWLFSLWRFEAGVGVVLLLVNTSDQI